MTSKQKNDQIVNHWLLPLSLEYPFSYSKHSLLNLPLGWVLIEVEGVVVEQTIVLEALSHVMTILLGFFNVDKV